MEQKAHFVLLPFQAIYKLKYERRKKKGGGSGGGGGREQNPDFACIFFRKFLC